jgi:hypothetical protein
MHEVYLLKRYMQYVVLYMAGRLETLSMAHP